MKLPSQNFAIRRILREATAGGGGVRGAGTARISPEQSHYSSPL